MMSGRYSRYLMATVAPAAAKQTRRPVTPADLDVCDQKRVSNPLPPLCLAIARRQRYAQDDRAEAGRSIVLFLVLQPHVRFSAGLREFQRACPTCREPFQDVLSASLALQSGSRLF